MPGYKLEPVEDFARLQSLLCPSCSCLLREALQTEQGVRLCKSCYDEIQNTPDHTCTKTGLKLEPNEPYHPDVAVRKEIDRLMVKCANHELGCSWEGTVKDHESVHKHQCPAPCSHKGCGRMLPATMLAYHMEEECEYRDVDCDDCGETMQYNQLQVHLDSQCPKRMVSCPNCQTRILNSAMGTHLIQQCPLQQCVACGTKVYRDTEEPENVDTHLSNPCVAFEHAQMLGWMVQDGQKVVQRLEENQASLRSEVLQGKAMIDSLDASTSKQIREMQELIHQKYGVGGKVQPDVASALKQLTIRVDKQDQIIQTLSTQGSYYPPNQAPYGREGVAAADKLAQVEKKVEEVERQTAMVKVHISELELQLQASLASTYNGAFLWRIPDVKRRKRDAIESKITSIYSPPFYTGRNGYKMCIRAYLNGDGIGANTHLSIFFVLMKGEYDPLLKWPFDYKVSLILVDQDHRRHIVQTFKPSPSSNSFKQPVQDMNIASGCPKFAELSVLDNESYVKEDVMYIKCIVDTSRIFHP